MSANGGRRAYLAVDLGAQSGRVFLGEVNAGIFSAREIHRFPNGPLTQGTYSYWDVRSLWSEICLAFADPQLPEIAGIGIDAWGVDYALIDDRGELLQNPYHYRNPRNLRAMEEVLEAIPKEEIYAETGVQFMPINTLNQLYAAQKDTPELLVKARAMLMIPDLFHYWLSGRVVCEFTVASTTQFANPRTRAWSTKLLERLGLPAHLPASIVEPGSVLGPVVGKLSNRQLRGAQVVAPCSHDTASAVSAVSATGSTVFLSSGTWSLLGIELREPVISSEAMRLNFTNEGGIDGTTRLLKNVMGLWMLQGCRKAWTAKGRSFAYKDIVDAAEGAPPFKHFVDPDDNSFLNPADMLAAVDDFCMRTDQPKPDGPGAYARAILESLALKYRQVVLNLEKLIGHPVERIRIIGGGSHNALLNQFTADATGKQVIAGPSEAAALGNLGVQMVATGAIDSTQALRQIIERSYSVEVFHPRDTAAWSREAERFNQYCEFSYA